MLLGTLIALQYLRVLTLFKASRTFGPLGEMLMKMLSQVKVFLFLMIGIISIFSNAGQVMFYNIPEFSDNLRSLVFLISASLGNFDYEIFLRTEGYSVYYGHIYLTLYLIISTITLLNFLIATLTSVYESLKSISIGLYMKEMIFIRHFYEDDVYYSSLI